MAKLLGVFSFFKNVFFKRGVRSECKFSKLLVPLILSASLFSTYLLLFAKYELNDSLKKEFI